MGRAPCCDKANVKRGPWSPEEDAKLKAYIEQYGTGGNWIALPQKIGLKRCGKSCRLRWLNYLRPNIKHGGFSEEEDNIICSLYISIGSRWSIIAAQLPGRTDNDIKNYWNTRLKKKLLGRRKQAQINRLSSANGNQDSSKVEDSNNTSSSSSSSMVLSNSALERLQLHMQLQNLQNPFSFHNNPSLWPKLHPLQEKFLLQSMAETSSSLLQHVLSTTSHHQQQDYSKLENPRFDVLGNSLNAVNGANNPVSGVMDSSIGIGEQSNAEIQPISSFQAELEDFLGNKTPGFVAQEDEFDCFKEMNNGSSNKDSMIWWSNNEFETRSMSSNSWDSTNNVVQFQDYEIGYNM